MSATSVSMLVSALVKARELKGMLGDSDYEAEAAYLISLAIEKIESAILKTKRK